MLLDEQEDKYSALNEWFKTPQGLRVAHAFAAVVHGADELLHGRTLLQLGHCGDDLWLPTLRYRNKWVLSPCIHLQKADFFSSLNALPIDRCSIDCIIAPLTMEAFARDKSPLDEIDRVLKPMGHVVFFGINPWSLWGAALKWGRLSCFGHASANLSSSLALKHALIARGYTQCALDSFYYIPPISNPRCIHRLEFLNEMGKMLWPVPAGFYCFIAQKYQPCQPSPRIELARNFHFAQA